MEKIYWDSSYNTGIRTLDDQHKQIVGLINLLLSKPDADVRSEVMSDALTRLTYYGRKHFEAEEQILEEHNYPELAQQKSEHKAYRIKIAQTCQETMLHKDSAPKELLQFIRNWWSHHILESDMKYKSFLLEHCVK